MNENVDLTLDRIFPDKKKSEISRSRTVNLSMIVGVKSKFPWNRTTKEPIDYNRNAVFATGNKEDRHRHNKSMEFKNQIESHCDRCGSVVFPWDNCICSKCDEHLESECNPSAVWDIAAINEKQRYKHKRFVKVKE